MAASRWGGMASFTYALTHAARRSLHTSSVVQSARLQGSGLAMRTRDVSVHQTVSSIFSCPRIQHARIFPTVSQTAGASNSFVQNMGFSVLCTAPRESMVGGGRSAWNEFAIGSLRFLGGQKDKQRRLAWKKVPGLGLPGGGKIKTHKGVSKRFTVTRRGKVGYFPMGRNHFNYGTSGRKRQQLRKKRFLSSKKQAKTIRQMLVMDRRPRFPYKPRGEPLKLRATPLEGPLDEASLMDYTPLKDKLKLVQKKKFLSEQ
mmetsp:Transcript_30918/g.72970  ORF Transcript_30918/g.72970 Transcript_30918/m.72970 type:complete len:258 (-) Transcript_30918:144-917(-)